MFKGELSDENVDRFFKEKISKENNLTSQHVEDDIGDCSDSIQNGEKDELKTVTLQATFQLTY